MGSISPKVLVPLAIAVAAAVALKFLTGDDTYLVGILVALVAAGGGVIAKPAPEVTMRDIENHFPSARRRKS